MTTVLGIRVTDRMLERWRGWTMPPVQPFLVPQTVARDVRKLARKRTLSLELRDTFQLYEPVPDDHAIVWLDRDGARLLPDEVIASQPTTHRWPTASANYDIKRAIGFVRQGVSASRHGEMTEATWKRASEILPDARRVAARFRDRSGPNCFGLVMAAAGITGADDECMQREPFETWLGEVTISGGNDELPGTVYIWRDDDGVIQHAGVSLGDGWYLHKASQGWMSPTLVLDVRDGIHASRQAGQYIERHTIIPPHLR